MLTSDGSDKEVGWEDFPSELVNPLSLKAADNKSKELWLLIINLMIDYSQLLKFWTFIIC